MRITLSILLLFAGTLFLLFPSISEYYHDLQQSKILKSWESTVIAHQTETESEFIPEVSRRSLEELEEVFQNSTEPESDDLMPIVSASKKQTDSSSVKITEPETMGIIEITKLNLRLPILTGTSEKVLAKGAGHLEGTAIPGEIGNTAIAAHRSRTYGRLFNRLGEVKVGDEININTNSGTFRYQVYNTLLVKPNDLSVLKALENEQILTLITCHPINNPTHRLIVHAKLEPS